MMEIELGKEESRRKRSSSSLCESRSSFEGKGGRNFLERRSGKRFFKEWSSLLIQRGKRKKGIKANCLSSPKRERGS